MLPGHQVCQERPAEIDAFADGPERRVPALGALPPIHGLEVRDLAESGELLPARSVQTCVANRCGAAQLRAGGAECDRNGYGRPDREDVFGLVRTSSLAAEIQDPDLVADPPHMLAHAAEGVPVQIARRRDETDDARASRDFLFKDLPERPAPEIDVEVVQVLDVDGLACCAGRINEGPQPSAVFASALANRTTRARFRVARWGLGPTVGRIAHADQDRCAARVSPCRGAWVGLGLEQRPLPGSGLWIFQRVRYADLDTVGRKPGTMIEECATYPKLGHRARAGHQFQAMEPAGQIRCVIRNKSQSLHLSRPLRCLLDDGQQIGSRARGRIQRCHLRVGVSERLVEAADEQGFDQANLGADDRDGGVIHASALTQ